MAEQSDKNSPEEEISVQHERFDVSTWIILSGWSLTLLSCFVIILVAAYLTLIGKPIDSPLKEWAGMALGFLLGSFVGLVKDYISKFTA